MPYRCFSRRFVPLLIWIVLLSAAPFACAKEASKLVTAAMRAHAVRNVERYAWARQRKEELVERVRPYLEMQAEALWLMLPSQEMGRDHSVYRHGKGCPRCFVEHGGAEVGVGRWHVDLLGRPWQVQCRRCNSWFPKNDFQAYYESALDERARFRLGEGDPQYLQPREGVEGEARQWIDDGAGLEYEGHQWFFAAKYADAVWREMAQVVEAFGELYTLTNDPRYAFRAAVILDRMAELYPRMDETPHRQRGMTTSYGPGRVMGRGWEYGALRRPVARAYDYIYDAIRDDTEVVRFAQRMSQTYHGPDKGSFAALDEHLRANLLVDMAEDAIAAGGEARGRSQTAVAVLATALDDPQLTPGYLDWLFVEDGGRLPYTMIEHMVRDGFNINSGMGYMIITGRSMHVIAEVLHRYGYDERDLYTDFPNFMNSFTMLSRVRVLGRTNPMIGDGGSSMAMAERSLPLQMLVNGYRVYGDEAVAREIAHYTDGDLKRILPYMIYEPEPEAILSALRAYVSGAPPPFASYNAGGFGLAVLQAPSRAHGRAAALYYGRAMHPSHAHADRLSLHLWAFGEVMMPDMGYPLYTGGWPKRHGFTRHTISHNTLMINDTRQGSSYSGKTNLFADVGPVRVADVDGLSADVDGRAWKQHVYDGVTTYRRAAIMIDHGENSYLLDLFWARGGKNHRLIQNGGGVAVTHSDHLSMTAQSGGTYAGPDVDYGQAYDGRIGWGYGGTGFQYLKDVERDRDPPPTFWIDWDVEAHYAHQGDWDAHMRLHNLTPVDELALANGEPSRGHPDQVRYSLRTRFGANLQSQFISVIEPYMHRPFIAETRILKRVEQPGAPFAAVVEVRFVDGSRDAILVREQAGELAAGDLYLNGRIGVIRFDDGGAVQRIIGIAAEQVRAGDHAASDAAPIRGALTGYDDGDPRNVKLHLNVDVPRDAAGSYIIFANDGGIADGSYRIERLIGPRTISIGRMPLFERLANPDDFAQGVLYNLAEGDTFIIPRAAEWRR